MPKRYPLKSKDAKQILQSASQTLKLDLEEVFGTKAIIEVVESTVGDIYLINNRPLLYKSQDCILPTLLFSEFTSRAPKIVVDMGAIPYVCKGATVMAPGIVRVEGDFKKGDLLLVSDVKHNKALAIGESIIDAELAKKTSKGPVVKNIHYVSDKIWEYIKTL